MDGVIISFVPVVAIIVIFGTIPFIVWTVVRGRDRRAQMQAEVQTRLIERFGSSAEFVEFLRSSEGRQFIGGLEEVPRVVASDHILSGFRRGTVMTLLGAAFLALAAFGERWGIYPGFILFFLGLAFFLSTFISVRLSRSWGLTGGLPPRNDTTGVGGSNP